MEADRRYRANNPEKFEGYKRRYSERVKAWYQQPINRERQVDLRYRRKYQVRLADYEQMLLWQGDRCAVCFGSETRQDSRTEKVCRLAIDHDHITGEVRGLLCSRCNQLVGRIEKVGLHAFVDYLAKGAQ